MCEVLVIVFAGLNLFTMWRWSQTIKRFEQHEDFFHPCTPTKQIEE